MFKRYVIVGLFVSACLACTKNAAPDTPEHPLVGSEIRFETSTVSFGKDPEGDSPDTKLDMKFYNSTYTWEEGDMIKIVRYSKDSGNEASAEYSYASSSWTSADPMKWDDSGAHDFFAVYPSSSEVSLVDPSLEFCDKAALVQVSIDKTQKNTNLGLNYATAGVYHADTPVREMSFMMYPLMTVLRFVFYNRTGTTLRVAPTQLVGWDETAWPSEQFNLYGKYQVRTEAAEPSTTWYKEVDSSFEGFTESPPNKSISLQMSSTVSSYSSWGFQVYVAPHDYKRFVLTVNLTKGTNAAQQKTITYTDSGNVFDPFMIHYLYVNVY